MTQDNNTAMGVENILQENNTSGNIFLGFLYLPGFRIEWSKKISLKNIWRMIFLLHRLKIFFNPKPVVVYGSVLAIDLPVHRLITSVERGNRFKINLILYSTASGKPRSKLSYTGPILTATQLNSLRSDYPFIINDMTSQIQSRALPSYLDGPVIHLLTFDLFQPLDDLTFK